MAAYDDETTAHRERPERPGDAAFARLTQRNSLKSKDLPPSDRPHATPVTAPTGSSAMQAAKVSSKPASEQKAPHGDSAAESAPGDDSTPRIMAVAAAFGFDVAPDLLQPEPGPPVVATLAKDDVAPDAATAPILMAAKALGVAAPAAPSRGAAKPAPVPSATLPVKAVSEARAMPAAVAEAPQSTPTPTIATPTIATPTDVAAPEAEDAVIVLSPELAADVPSVPDSEDDAVDAVADAPAAVASPALEADPGLDGPSLGDERPEPDAIAERLEAALLGQLRVLEETLQVPPSILPRTAPLRAAAPPER
ncbi:MAG: hypothetical protein J0H08_01455, partial [Rhizobiales bacterium]|nr:hypothetical protein [Hyphomicrobiales bacterium]